MSLTSRTVSMTVTVPHLMVRSVTDNSTLGHQQLAVTRIESVRVMSDTVLLLSVLSRERHWNFSYGENCIGDS
jgi:hypothetical protein